MTTQLLQVIEGLNSLTTTQEILGRVGNALNLAGLRYFSLNFLPRPEVPFSEQIMGCEVPQEWLDLYLREDFAAVDPAIRHCRKVALPFDYRDAPFDAEREPRAAEVMQRARDFGVDDGMMFPITGPSGCVGDLWVGGKQPEFQCRDIPSIHLLALYAFHKIQEFIGQSCRSAGPSLSNREREVLTCVAGGKTAAEVGEVLNISQRTVEWHIQQAAQKLGAKNRMQAVVIAARDQLIQI